MNLNFNTDLCLSLEPPEPPDPPILHFSPTGGIGSDVFAVRWTAPQDTGGLAVLNYTVEVIYRGSPFCPIAEARWEVVRSGVVPEATPSSPQELQVREGVYAGTEYQYRVTVFTSLFSTQSQPSPSFTTPSAGIHLALALGPNH